MKKTGKIPYVFDLHWDVKDADQAAAMARELRGKVLHLAASYTHLVAEMEKHGMGDLVKSLPREIKVVEVR